MIRSSAVNWIPNVNVTSERMEKLDYAAHINNFARFESADCWLSSMELIVSEVMWKIENWTNIDLCLVSS